MTYIECPDEYVPDFTRMWDPPSVFLAGGITGCPDWQREIRPMLKGFIILNPRRKNFPMDDPTAARYQIAWEHRHLRKADAIVFWFPRDNAAGCPIALFELGSWSVQSAKVAVGIERGYVREDDVRIQMELLTHEVPIVSSLPALAEKVRGFFT